MKKIRIDQHRAAAELRSHRNSAPLYLVLDNIRSLNNVGAMFRLADGLGVRKIYLGGITPSPPRPEIAKIALGAENSVQYEWHEDPAKALLLLRAEGVHIACLEQTDVSVPVDHYPFPQPLALVVGHETVGIDEQLLHYADAIVDIPMYGSKHSHNVATSAAIALYEIRRQWSGMPDI